MISVRTLNPSQRMDCGTSAAWHTSMEMRHSPVEGYDQCKQASSSASEAQATSMDFQKLSYVSLLVPPRTSSCSPAKSTPWVNNQSTNKMKISSWLHSSIKRRHNAVKCRSRSVINPWFCMVCFIQEKSIMLY
ncbi:hypothetical protein BVRB_7g162750 [Beta vulgaris subsp. vulgaris]|nr:hypothetical protein BVRB_7g162750 [Beta vulgaris subsp. vulgaris]